MANRYWVGGTANWDGTAGTKWATTSGGAGGAAVPTSADDVFFDASSGANTVTVSGSRVAKSITCTGFTGTLAGTGDLAIYGNVTLVSGMTLSHTGSWSFNATGTLTSAGKTLNGVTFSGSGGTLTLGDALTISSPSDLTLLGGTFDTSGSNYNVTVYRLSLGGGSAAKTVNLNGSTVTLSANGPLNITGTNTTFNAGTSQINCTAPVTSFDGNGFTFYNVAFQSTLSTGQLINGANTFNNLSITAPSSTGLTKISISANQVINGTLTCSGATAVRRIWLASDTLGTARTISIATCAPADCDFRDIAISGGASPISGTRLGDCGGNSGITFPAPKTVYWNPASSATFTSASWATSSGSTTLSTNNFPLAQDTAVFDNASRAGVSSNSSAKWNIGTFNASSRTSALSIGLGTSGLNVYGSWLFGTGVSPTGTGATISFVGRGTQTITSNGIQFPTIIEVAGVGNTVQLADALSAAAAMTLTSGTFDAVSYNVSAATCSITGTGTRTLTMGSGAWTLTSTGTVWSAATTTNLTFNKNTANITLSNTTTTARTFAGGGLTYNKLTIGGTTGTSTLTFTGSNTFSELASTKTVAHTMTFTAGTTTTVTTWSIGGTAGNIVTLGSTSSSAFTLSKAGGGTVSADYLSISYSTATPDSTWYAGGASTNGGHNTGWIFSTSSKNFFSILKRRV